MKYQKHIFVCINEREEGAKRQSCGKAIGEEIAAKFKALIKEHKLKATVRAQRSSCLDVCEDGPTMVVYPEGIFYKNIQLTDVTEIFESHIINNQPVERLTLTFEK